MTDFKPPIEFTNKNKFDCYEEVHCMRNTTVTIKQSELLINPSSSRMEVPVQNKAVRDSEIEY